MLSATLPEKIVFFPNGMVAVYDFNGEQMPKYQGAGRHFDVIAALEADNIDWRSLIISGQPTLPPYYDRVGNVINYNRQDRNLRFEG